MPNDLVASRSLATANPAAARSSASSHEAGRSSPLSRTRGWVNRTCLLIERTFLAANYHSPLYCWRFDRSTPLRVGSVDLCSAAKNGRRNMSYRDAKASGLVPPGSQVPGERGGQFRGPAQRREVPAGHHVGLDAQPLPGDALLQLDR